MQYVYGSVDTRDSFQKTFWPIWDSVSTLAQVVSTLDQLPKTFWVKLGQCVDTSSSSVGSRELPRTPSGLFWDRVSTQPQVVSTLVAFPEQNTWLGCYRDSLGSNAHCSRTLNTSPLASSTRYLHVSFHSEDTPSCRWA
ncbi:hypothetical protein Taro_015661 [Colocasia esculenta]|uniref:Uncharacterized protein n=1 Tax=Colocasia esculenta TaxID=4460 RepID=A0A843ULU1_COLES|nr:hypothetical protein [Colocasia esculenta]